MQVPCTEKELFIFNKIARAAGQLGQDAYVIGGFVRDKLLGRPTKDADIVTMEQGLATVAVASAMLESAKKKESVKL